jgi:F-type H+-transporting ATPase subunit c
MKLTSRLAVAVVMLALFTGVSFAQVSRDVPEPEKQAEREKEAHKKSIELAQASAAKFTGIGAGIGMGLAIVGAGIGIGLVGHSALAGIARQPEQAGTIRGTMILLAALVEGAALIVVVFCLVLSLIA